jgi:hypothetical protein
MTGLEQIGGRRRSGLVALAVIALAAALVGAVVWSRSGTSPQTSAPAEQVFDLHIERGAVGQEVRTLRVTQGDEVHLRWTVDAPMVLHLHGYDLEQEVIPGKVTDFHFTADATGRFPVEIHRAGDASDDSGDAHDEAPVVVLEVYPR